MDRQKAFDTETQAVIFAVNVYNDHFYLFPLLEDGRGMLDLLGP
jgi:hypothetical protein